MLPALTSLEKLRSAKKSLRKLSEGAAELAVGNYDKSKKKSLEDIIYNKKVTKNTNVQCKEITQKINR